MSRNKGEITLAKFKLFVMRLITAYTIYYTPGGRGGVSFKIEGFNEDLDTGLLDASAFVALCSLFHHPKVYYNPAAKTFAVGSNQ